MLLMFMTDFLGKAVMDWIFANKLCCVLLFYHKCLKKQFLKLVFFVNKPAYLNFFINRYIFGHETAKNIKIESTKNGGINTTQNELHNHF